MNSTKWLSLAAWVLGLLLGGGCGQQEDKTAGASSGAGREIINASRLKKLTAGLELTAEQQEKVKGLFAEESQALDKIHAEGANGGAFNARRVIEARNVTYEKIKALLTPAQLEKFDEVVNKLEGRRKRRSSP